MYFQLKSLFFVLTVSLTTSFFMSTSYADYAINGTVSQVGCNSIHGAVIPSPSLESTGAELCQFSHAFFRITPRPTNCDQVATQWKDPISGYTYQVPSTCDLPQLYQFTSTTGAILAPLKQFRSGIAAHDVKCNQQLILIIRIADNSPACVTHQTALKLVARGWGIMIPSSTMVSSAQSSNSTLVQNSIQVKNTDFTVNYSISGGKLVEVKNIDGRNLVATLEMTNNGQMGMTMPTQLINFLLPPMALLAVLP